MKQQNLVDIGKYFHWSYDCNSKIFVPFYSDVYAKDLNNNCLLTLNSIISSLPFVTLKKMIPTGAKKKSSCWE